MKNIFRNITIVSAALIFTGTSQAALVNISLTGSNEFGSAIETVFSFNSEDMLATQNSIFGDGTIALTSAQYISGGTTTSFDVSNGYYGSDINGETIEFRAGSNSNTLQLGSFMGGFADFRYNETDNTVSYSGTYNDPVTSWTDFSFEGSRFSVDIAAMQSGGFTGFTNDGTNLADYSVDTLNVSVSAVPVPAAVWLFGSGLIGLMTACRRRAK